MVLSLLSAVTFAEQDPFLTPVTDMEAAADSEIPMYLYGLQTGICTVCGREIQEVIPALTPAFSGKSISLQDDFSINFYVDSAAFADGVYRNPYVIFELEGNQTTVAAFAQQDEYYIFTYEDITPDKMGQKVQATLYADKQDGTQFSVSTAYSVAEYCYAALEQEQTTDTMRTLLVDTLTFGAVCQQYRNGDVAAQELVNAALMEEQQGWGSDETIRKLNSCRDFGNNNGSVKWYGVSALMGDRVQMRVYFTAEEVTGLTVQAVSDSGQWVLDNIKTKDGLYYVDFGYLNPAQMNEKVSFTVYQGENAVSSVLDYSIESYAAVWVDKTDARPEQAELVKAIIRYGDAAKAYVDRTYDLQEDVRYLGRTYEAAGTQWFNWSASGFSVRFQGSGLKAKIASNAPNVTNYAYLKVYVDGVEQTDILLDKTLQPDVIVINLGTNDATNSNLNLDAFEAGVYSFIKLVRQKNPNAQIIWVYGLRSDKMTAQVAAAIEAAVARVSNEGDDHVHYLPLALATDMHLNHPTAAAYAPSGERLIEKIEEITGW